MTDFLFYGDTERSYAMRHELPVVIGDPFVLAIVDGRMHVSASFLDRARVAAAVPDAVIHDFVDLGLAELRTSGISSHQLDVELASRAASAMGVSRAVADPEMAVAIADRLRADGVDLDFDAAAIEARRRVKSETELAGIRRATVAANAGHAAAAAVLRRAVPDGDKLRVDGEILTSETVRAAIREACAQHGAPAPPDITVSSVWNGGGHDPGLGPLPANLPIIVDLWPRDEETGCWGDQMRTFVVGEIPDEVQRMATVVLDAVEAARALIRPGVSGREVYEAAAEVVEAAGFRTQRTENGGVPEDGFQASLGHGVGLAVHEPPLLGLAGRGPLVAGDVVTIEPGIFVAGLGEVCFEDILVVTDDGSETLTDVPYDLTP